MAIELLAANLMAADGRSVWLAANSTPPARVYRVKTNSPYIGAYAWFGVENATVAQAEAVGEVSVSPKADPSSVIAKSEAVRTFKTGALLLMVGLLFAAGSYLVGGPLPQGVSAVLTFIGGMVAANGAERYQRAR